MPDSEDIYNRLAMLGFGPEEVANMTPRQQLMYFGRGETSSGSKPGVDVLDSMAEAEALVAKLRAEQAVAAARARR